MANSLNEWEEALAKATLLKTNLTAPVKVFIGCSTLKASEVTKKLTTKEFGEKEPKESAAWKRIELSTEAADWKVTKAEGETGKTKYTYEKEVKFEKLTSEEYKLETFGLFSELAPTALCKFLGAGKMEPIATINSGSELKIEAGKLIVEFEVV